MAKAKFEVQAHQCSTCNYRPDSVPFSCFGDWALLTERGRGFLKT